MNESTGSGLGKSSLLSLHRPWLSNQASISKRARGARCHRSMGGWLRPGPAALGKGFWLNVGAVLAFL